MNVTGLRVTVDWSECFVLNGPLDTYVLLENGLLTYEGQQNTRDLGTRNIGGESSDSTNDIFVPRAAPFSKPRGPQHKQSQFLHSC